MPRNPDLSWQMKCAIWDLASKLGKSKHTAIQRSLDQEDQRVNSTERVPGTRKIKEVIQELQSIPIDLLKDLPSGVWHIREDFKEIGDQLVGSASGVQSSVAASTYNVDEDAPGACADAAGTTKFWDLLMHKASPTNILVAALRGELPDQLLDENKETHLIRDMATIFLERLPEATVEEIAREIAEEHIAEGRGTFMHPDECATCMRKF